MNLHFLFCGAKRQTETISYGIFFVLVYLTTSGLHLVVDMFHASFLVGPKEKQTSFSFSFLSLLWRSM